MSVIKEPINFSQGEPYTFITIADKRIPLYIDTGAANAYLVLSKHALKNVKVAYTGKLQCFRALDGRYCMKKFIIPSVKIGRDVLHDVPGEEMQHLWDNNHNKGFIETEASRNGVIGLALLRHYNVLLDYKNKEISYLPHRTTPRNLDLKSCYSIKTKLSNGIFADFIFNNRANKMVLDTGASVSIIKSSNASKKLYPCKFHKSDFKNCKIDKISLFENQKPENFYVDEFDLPFDGFIGSDYIQNHKIFIDSVYDVVYFC